MKPRKRLPSTVALLPVKGSSSMHWEHIQRNWTQFKARAKEQWSKLGEAQLEAIAGRRDLLVRRIRDAYGISSEDAEKQLVAWQRSLALPVHARS